MVKSLLVGMVVFDLFLHIWQLTTKKYFIFFQENTYDFFWTSFWLIFLILLVYEFYWRSKDGIHK